MKKFYFSFLIFAVVTACSNLPEVEPAKENHDITDLITRASLDENIVGEPSGNADKVQDYIKQIANIPVRIHLNDRQAGEGVYHLAVIKPKALKNYYLSLWDINNTKNIEGHINWVIVPDMNGRYNLVNHYTQQKIDYTITTNSADVFISNNEAASLTFNYDEISGLHKIAGGRTLNLQPVSEYDYTLTMSYNDDYLSNWYIEPDEEFELIDVEYDFVNGDTFNKQIYDIKERAFTNPLDDPANFEYSYQETNLTESTFSESSSYKTIKTIESTTSVKVGIPQILGGADVSTTLKTSQTTEKSHTYTTSEKTAITTVETIKYNFSIPAKTSGKFVITQYGYNANITYIAKYKSKFTNTIVYDKGRWSGLYVSGHSITPIRDDGVILPLYDFGIGEPENPEIITNQISWVIGESSKCTIPGTVRTIGESMKLYIKSERPVTSDVKVYVNSKFDYGGTTPYSSDTVFEIKKGETQSQQTSMIIGLYSGSNNLKNVTVKSILPMKDQFYIYSLDELKK